MLYVILIILLIAIIALLVELCCFSTIYVSYKKNVLTLRINTPLYRKVITREFTENKAEKKLKNESEIENKDKQKPNKADEIKKRIFNSDTGFDVDELKNVWSELTDMYSYGMGILKKLLSRLRHKIHIKKTYVKLEYGTDNPAATGIVYGSFWNLISILYPITTMYFRMDYPMLDITPDFYNERFDIEAESIIKVKAAHIISAGLSSLLVPAITYFKDKSKKGREK